MKSLRFLALIAAAEASLTSFVNPLIGTGGLGFGAGSINPGPQVPGGAMRLGPDTTMVLGENTTPSSMELWLPFQHFGGYSYEADNYIRAFSLTHLVGAGIADWGNFGLQAFRGNLSTATISNTATQPQYKSKFSHKNETAEVGYYSVFLEDPQALAELTVSGTHAGMLRFTFFQDPASTSPCSLIFDPIHSSSEGNAVSIASVNVTLSNNAAGAPVAVVQSSLQMQGGLSGRLNGGVPIFFHGEIDATTASGASVSPDVVGLWQNGGLLPSYSPSSFPSSGVNASTTTSSLGAYLSFNAPSSSSSSGAPQLVVTVRVGLSFVDLQGAKNNLYSTQQQQSRGERAEERQPTATKALRKGKTKKNRAKPVAEASSTLSWLSFEELCQQTVASWEEALGRVQVVPPSDSTNSSDQLTVFYTALYHALFAPTIYSEADGRYVGMDGGMHTVAGGFQYRSDMSIWDIHRTQAPLMTLVRPEAANDIQRSLLQMWMEGGRLPRWPLAQVYTGCMVGSHGLVILADYLTKQGLLPAPMNASLVYQATLSALNIQDDANWVSLGYLPSEETDVSASSTLEFALDDAAGAVIAAFNNQQPAQAAVWKARSLNYRNVFSVMDVNGTSPNSGKYASSPIPCRRSGQGNKAFNCPSVPDDPYPFNDGGYIEGDALQYQTFALQDMPGLVKLWPSPEAFVASLDVFMKNQTGWADTIGNALPNPFYWAGNEPGLAAPWQFAAAGPQYAARTQYWTRWLLSFYYTNSPQGIPGNDDFGTMSSWAVWAYLGLYPISGMGFYALGSPAFASVNVTVPSTVICGAQQSTTTANSITVLQIVAHNASSANAFVSSVAANGKAITSGFLAHDDLFLSPLRAACDAVERGDAEGISYTPALLEFTMTDTPSFPIDAY